MYMFKVLCILAGNKLTVPVYQNAHVSFLAYLKIVFARTFIPVDVYFIFSVPLLTFITFIKGEYLLILWYLKTPKIVHKMG